MSIESKIDIVQQIIEWSKELSVSIDKPETDYDYIGFVVHYFITESDLIQLKLVTKAKSFSVHASGLISFEIRLHF